MESGANDAPNFQAVEEKLLANAAKAKEGARPSMGQDMLKGRRTEIEFINGLVADKGKEIGIPTPASIKLVEAVQLVEQGKAPAGIERLM